jgi:hypothetical protein
VVDQSDCTEGIFKNKKLVEKFQLIFEVKDERAILGLQELPILKAFTYEEAKLFLESLSTELKMSFDVYDERLQTNIKDNENYKFEVTQSLFKNTFNFSEEYVYPVENHDDSDKKRNQFQSFIT